jgi:ArsR family transcriptional regulator
VFYRLAGQGHEGELIGEALARLDPADPVLVRDAERLTAVRAERAEAASDYFARNAARWDEIRSLYVAERDVEAAILKAAGPGPFKRLVDLGSGTGRMLTLLGPHADQALGLDLNQQMLNIARNQVGEAGLGHCELRHGDIFGTRLPDGSADLVVVHQVLHYLADPAAAVKEAARIVGEGGRLIIVDFAPHSLEFLREQHQHRRLGFADPEMKRWLHEAGLSEVRADALPPARAGGLTVKIWTAERARARQRTAA